MIHYEEFETKTGGRLDAIDITDEVVETAGTAGVERGSVLVFSPHTTCCVMLGTNGLQASEMLARGMELIAPSEEYYAHDDLEVRTENLVEHERPNAPAHLFHMFAGTASQIIPIVDGRVALGGGQRVLFVELDCSRLRRYCIQVVGE